MATASVPLSIGIMMWVLYRRGFSPWSVFDARSAETLKLGHPIGEAILVYGVTVFFAMAATQIISDGLAALRGWWR
ncbi:MAG TPA: hypothetical protein VN154_07595, partial [Rhizomicrobium sp.]|nr:hypothetical protein [Rhizomicrobium sp.]